MLVANAPRPWKTPEGKRVYEEAMRVINDKRKHNIPQTTEVPIAKGVKAIDSGWTELEAIHEMDIQFMDNEIDKIKEYDIRRVTRMITVDEHGETTLTVTLDSPAARRWSKHVQSACDEHKVFEDLLPLVARITGITARKKREAARRQRKKMAKHRKRNR